MADVARFYPSIPQEVGLKAPEKALNNCNNKTVSTEDLVKNGSFCS